jgi:WD40 repeat protein
MFGGGNVSNRLKFSLRGRALAGHRGGVTCIDVPSNVYRPDSLVTGGADGLIKLWSLRALATGRRSSAMTSQQDTDGTGAQSRGGDALNVFSGHSGRVICVLSAWHGDRLLSGGADRTLRVWDLARGNGKCINKLCGHSGWVTMVKYWGPNTVVSASTDRSIALWDARLRDSPLFLLRSHRSPISDFLVGSRTDPMMISAGTDGTISTWDFRKLSGSHNMKSGTPNNNDSLSCHVVRVPARSLTHEVKGAEKLATSSVRLARGFCNSRSSFLSVGSDAVVREWDISTGQQLDSLSTGHADAVTCVQSFGQSDEMTPSSRFQEGMITSSWDGTIRMKLKRT